MKTEISKQFWNFFEFFFVDFSETIVVHQLDTPEYESEICLTGKDRIKFWVKIFWIFWQEFQWNFFKD